jgi:hypothetical protein
MLQRAKLDRQIGDENFFWSADLAIYEAEQRQLRQAGHDGAKSEGGVKPTSAAVTTTALALHQPATTSIKGKKGKK